MGTIVMSGWALLWCCTPRRYLIHPERPLRGCVSASPQRRQLLHLWCSLHRIWMTCRFHSDQTTIRCGGYAPDRLYLDMGTASLGWGRPQPKLNVDRTANPGRGVTEVIAHYGISDTS